MRPAFFLRTNTPEVISDPRGRTHQHQNRFQSPRPARHGTLHYGLEYPEYGMGYLEYPAFGTSALAQLSFQSNNLVHLFCFFLRSNAVEQRPRRSRDQRPRRHTKYNPDDQTAGTVATQDGGCTPRVIPSADTSVLSQPIPCTKQPQRNVRTRHLWSPVDPCDTIQSLVTSPRPVDGTLTVLHKLVFIPRMQ